MVDILQTKKKILIIGYGAMGKKYENALKKNFLIDIYDKNKKIRNVNINNINLKKNKNKYYFAIISTPANSHLKYCSICAKAGLSFIVEKPLFIKKNGWHDVINHIKKNKIVTSVAYPRRYGKAYNFIKKLIKSGKIGKLKIIKSNYSQNFRILRKDYKKIYYSNENNSGGIIYDALSHHLNLQSFYGGKIKNITKVKKRLEFKDVKVSDTGIVIIKFKKNILGLIFGNQFQSPNIDEIEFVGSKKNLIYNRIDNKIFLAWDKKKKIIKRFNENYENLFKSQLDDFLKCLKKKSLPKTTVAEEWDNLIKLK